MTGVGAAIAAGFGLFFAAAVAGKLDAWDDWKAAVTGWTGNVAVGRAVKAAVPVAEALVVVLLFMRPAEGLVAAAAVLASLGLGVLSLRRAHEGADCGCFGNRSKSKIGLALALRNLILAGVAGSGAWFAHRSGDVRFSAAEVLAVLLLGVGMAVAFEFLAMTKARTNIDQGLEAT